MPHDSFCFDSIQKSLLFYDDFEGDSLKDEWLLTVVGTGAGVVIDGLDGGVYRLSAPTNATADSARIDWSNIRSLAVTKKVIIEARVKMSHSTYINSAVGLSYDANNYIEIYASEGVGGATNWRIITILAGVVTDLDTNIVADTLWYILRIECHTHGGNHIHFYIDGVETANSPISTNIPVSYLQPHLIVVTRTAAERQFNLDYVVIVQNR